MIKNINVYIIKLNPCSEKMDIRIAKQIFLGNSIIICNIADNDSKR